MSDDDDDADDADSLLSTTICENVLKLNVNVKWKDKTYLILLNIACCKSTLQNLNVYTKLMGIENARDRHTNNNLRWWSKRVNI